MESWTRRQNPVNEPTSDSPSQSKSSRSCHKSDQAKELLAENKFVTWNETDQTRLLQVDKLCYTKSGDTIEKQKQKQTEEPQDWDVALYQQLYNQLMARHQQLQEKC